MNFIDFHTGLGPYGYAEPLSVGPARTQGFFALAPESGRQRGPCMERDAIALECGIRPINEVALALRPDAWLHAHGELVSSEDKSIKSTPRAAFHADDLLWQGMALGQGLAACQAAVTALL